MSHVRVCRWAVLTLALITGGPALAQAPSRPEKTLLRGFKQILSGKGGRGFKSFRQAQEEGLAPAKMRTVRGMAQLALGHSGKARKLLPKTPQWAVYRAMAVSSGPGGIGRAQSILGRAISKPEAGAGTHFLAALAFSRAGQVDAADKQLQLAARKSAHALGPSWAPDPAVGLSQAVLQALEGVVSKDEARVAVSEALVQSGRRGAALVFTALEPDVPELRIRAHRVRTQALAAVGPQYTVDAVQAWVEAAPKSAEARLYECEERLAEQDWAGAERTLEPIAHWPKPLKARAERARGLIALETGKKKKGLRHARAAVRAAPKSILARALLAEALLANGETNRAGEIAERLLSKRAMTVNAFALLAKVRERQGRTRKLEALQMRAQGLQTSLTRPKLIVSEVEKVLGAVRDAEAGHGVSGLSALRDQDPRLALPIDIALARLGRRGVARQARDRILTACTPHIRRLLTRRTTWDQGQVNVSAYGKASKIPTAFSAADPYRCRGGPVKVGAQPRPRRAR